jgi:hypothetical protein
MDSLGFKQLARSLHAFSGQARITGALLAARAFVRISLNARTWFGAAFGCSGASEQGSCHETAVEMGSLG